MYKVSTRLAFKIWEHLVSTHGYVRSLERLSFTMTSNGKSDLYHVTKCPLTYRLLFTISTHKLIVLRNLLSVRIILNRFYLIFYFEKFSTWIWRFPFAVCRLREA